MTIDEAIKHLETVRAKTPGKDGGAIEVYFDCPFCEKSFTPNVLVKQAVHLTADLREKDHP